MYTDWSTHKRTRLDCLYSISNPRCQSRKSAMYSTYWPINLVLKLQRPIGRAATTQSNQSHHTI